MIAITEMQRDALLEVFNIGLGKAAASLSTMVRQEIRMAAPSLEIYSKDAPQPALAETEKQRISAVSQRFSGAFDADAMLVFPEDKTITIVHKMLGESVPLAELTELEQEAMSEIGNIILNGCISVMADLFRTEFSSTLPVYHLGTPAEILRAPYLKDDSLLLILHVDFHLTKDEIRGYVAFLLNVSSFKHLLAQIDAYLDACIG